MANAGYLSVELFKLWFIDGVNGSAPYSFHDYQCELYGPSTNADGSKVPWFDTDYRPLCPTPKMPAGWIDGELYNGTGLPGQASFCNENNSVSMGGIYFILCVFFFLAFATCAGLLTKWFRMSRIKRKTKSNPHPPFNSTEKFYVLSIITSATGVLMALDFQGAGGITPPIVYSFFAGSCGTTVNMTLIVMVTNWITILTARGKDISMLPWVKHTYYFGMGFSSIDAVITAAEGLTHPIEGAYSGTVNGLKHLSLAILEGYFCFLGLYFALRMRNQMSGGGGIETDAQKKSVARIVGYAKVIVGCGTCGVLFRLAMFAGRFGKTVYPAPGCSSFGAIMGSLVEFIVLLVCVAVVIAQKPASSAKVGANNMLKTSMDSAASSGSSGRSSPR